MAEAERVCISVCGLCHHLAHQVEHESVCGREAEHAEIRIGERQETVGSPRVRKARATGNFHFLVVSLCVCVCACVRVCVCVCVCMCVGVCVYVCVRFRKALAIGIFLFLIMNLWLCVTMRGCVRMCVCVSARHRRLNTFSLR